MSGFLLGLLIFVIVSSAAFMAMRVRRRLPPQHLNSETKELVKLTMGMVGTMTALILGLLVSSAKDKYQAEQKAMTDITTKLIFSDRALASYGAQAQPARTLLRSAVELSLTRYWPENQPQSERLMLDRSSSEAVYFAVQQLSPQNEAQRALKELALDNLYDIGQTRWMMAGQADPSLCVPLLVFVICWLAILFFSFGLFAPNNGTVYSAFIIAAICVAGAVFLILELDQPFGGLIKISSQPLLNTLKLMGH